MALGAAFPAQPGLGAAQVNARIPPRRYFLQRMKS